MDHGSDRFAVREDVAVSPLDDELALLDLSTGEYFTLNSTGTFLWSELHVPRSRDELFARMLEEFEVEPTVARDELDGYLSSLVSSGLLKRIDA